MAHHQTIALSSAAVPLGPLGQELAESNEAQEKIKVEQKQLSEGDRQVVVGSDGVISIPAVAHNKPSGYFASMKSFSGGQQLHCTGGFKAVYSLEVPRAGKYMLAIRVVTVQEGQKFLLTPNNSKVPVEIAVPYTLGQWQQTHPVEISLNAGKNELLLALQNGSRGVTLKDVTLSPVN